MRKIMDDFNFIYLQFNFYSGGKVKEFLPSVDALLMEPELGVLAASSNFQFLVKLLYEYAYDNY